MSDDVLERAVRAQEQAAADYAEALRQWRADRRERIAVAALQGLLAAPSEPPFSREGVFEGIAKCAIKYADALIAELDKENGR